MRGKRQLAFVTIVVLLLGLMPASQALAEGRPSLPDRVRAGGGPPLSGAVEERRPDLAKPPGGGGGSPTSDDLNLTVNSAPQNETTMSHNPANPSLLVAGANDYGLGDSSAGYYFSNNGGKNWTRALLPRLNYDAGCDPAVAYGLDNKVYYSYLAFNRNAPGANELVVATLDGSELTATAGEAVSNATVKRVVYSPNDLTFHDKPYLAVDSNPLSANAGNVYVSWTQFNSNPDGSYRDNYIMFARLTPDGAGFSQPKRIDGGLTSNQGSVLALGPDGTVYVVWQDFANSRHVIVRSTDGGASFDSPKTVTSLANLPSPLPGSRFRTNSFPSAKVGPDGTIYVAWANWEYWTVVGSNANVRLTWSSDGGNTWSGGGTWGNATLLNTAVIADQFFPWIVGFDSLGKAHTVFYDRRDDRSNKKFNVYRAVFNRNAPLDSSDRLTNTRVTEVASDPAKDGFGGKFIGDYIGGTYNGNPIGAWTDTRTGNAEAFADPNG